MKILWEHGELKPSQIQDRYSRPIKNAAVVAENFIQVNKF
jgi:hypothetical protein